METIHTEPPNKTIKIKVSQKTALQVAAVLILLAVSFYGGTLYQKAHANSAKALTASRTNSQGQIGAYGRGGRFGGMRNVGDQGTVAAISSSSISVKAGDGSTKNYAIDSGTSITKDRAAASINDISTGDSVFVIPSRTNTSTAGRIIITTATGTSDSMNTPSVNPGNVQSN